jgi:hypothetical protein
MTNPKPPAELVKASITRQSGQRSLPKAGLLSTTGLVGAARACQLVVE